MSLLSSNTSIKSKIDELWNKFWSGGISNPLTAIEQITYLLFMKKLDNNDLENIAKANSTGKKYRSKFEGFFVLPKDKPQKGATKKEIKRVEKEKGIDKNKLRWSEFKKLSPNEMLEIVQQYAFPFIKNLNGENTAFTKHMANAVFMIPKPSLLKNAIEVIETIYEEIEKDATENGQDFQDIQGDVYEYLLNEIARAGKNGQFRTPRHIIKLLVEMVAPKISQKIADPACGTAGFLLGAYQYMATQLNTEPSIKPDEDGFILKTKSSKLTEKKKKLLEESLYGFDIDQTMVRLGLMNLMMHGIQNPQLDYKDTLSKNYLESSEYDFVLANPPFTGSIDKGDIHESLSSLNSTKSELLFINRIFNMLKAGGTAGIIVPQGVLFGSSKAFVETRKLMIQKSELKAVVTMPSGVFKPYAGVSTALLIFTKGGETKQVWFYDMKNDGYSLDDKRNKLEGFGDLQEILNEYKARDPKKENDRKGKFFFVPINEIKAEKYDLSYSRYKKVIDEDIEYEKPELILEKLIGKDGNGGLEKKIINGLKALKELEI